MLVACVAYAKGQRLADIPVSAISEHLSAPDTFVWVALKDPAPEELAAVQDEFDLHDLAIEDALKGNQRPKLEEYGSSIFVVMHIIEPARRADPGAPPDSDLHVGEMAVFVGPKFVVSVRRGTEQGFSEVRRRCEHEPELLQYGPGYVLYALMDSVVDRYAPVLDRLRACFDDVERQIFEGASTRAQIEALYSLKRQLTVVDHAVIPLIEVTGKLHGGRVPAIVASLGEYFRDVSDHLLHLRQSTDSLRDALATAISVNLSLITLQENEVTKRLAAYASLVAVPTAIAGIYGMNFVHMPELRWRYGYPAVLALMAIVDLYLVYRFKKANWL